MFTGLVQAIGKITAMASANAGLRLSIATAALAKNQLQQGASIAINGVCLTVTEYDSEGFCADVSAETLRCTTLGELTVASPVNLEPALTLQTPLGGHLVSGHVDGIGQITELESEGNSTRYRIQVPTELARYIAVKGSITVDGVSLTVNQVTTGDFTVNIIPHTWDNTLFQYYQLGSKVNLEVDLLARYLERLLLNQSIWQK